MTLPRSVQPSDRLGQDAARWVVLADGRKRVEHTPVPNMRRAVKVFAALSAVALVATLLLVFAASGRAAQQEALRDAGADARLLAISVIEPVLDDALLDADPDSAARRDAVERLDAVVRDHVLTDSRVRVKLWASDGTIVYSDEERLMGQQFTLEPEESEVLRGGPPQAELSDLSGPENIYERSQGELFEVYRHVDLPSGKHLLFETYSRYADLTERRADVLRSFVPIAVGAVLLLQLCQLPLVWSLVRRLRAAEHSREVLLRNAIDASTAERRRMAGNVHDNVVQGLAGASFVIAGAVDTVRNAGLRSVADDLHAAAVGVRESIGGLRASLLEIYPPKVSDTGLVPALHDLIAPLRTQGMDASAVTTLPMTVPPEHEALVFRVAQEALRNVAQHSAAHTVTLTLTTDSDATRLQITDDGAGMDVERALHRDDGHFGMQILRDLAAEAGALLQIRSQPGAGTTVRLEVLRASHGRRPPSSSSASRQSRPRQPGHRR